MKIFRLPALLLFIAGLMLSLSAQASHRMSNLIDKKMSRYNQKKFDSIFEQLSAGSYWSDLSANSDWNSLMNRTKQVQQSRHSLTDVIRFVNLEVNRFITYTTDDAQYGREHWASPLETLRNKRGDCDDYVVLKYFALREFTDSSDMYFAIVKTENNRSHLILIANTGQEFLILDNRTNALAPLEKTGYTDVQVFNEYGEYEFQKVGDEDFGLQ